MLNKLKELLLGSGESGSLESTNEDQEKKVRIATGALFLEVANSDDNFTSEEKEKIISLMKRLFELDEDHVRELLELSKQKMEKSVSLYEYTNVINQNFSDEEKYRIIKKLWRLAFVDGKHDRYEDHIIRTINRNLKLSHSDFVTAKMEVKKEMENL